MCVQEILSFDFPERWPEVPGKLQTYLTTDTGSVLHGALLVLYQLVKKYECVYTIFLIVYIQYICWWKFTITVLESAIC